MSESAATPPPPSPVSHDEHHPSYVTIWAILLALLLVSVAGPTLGIRIVTLITAFGIAIVKAYLVARHFMHVNLERKWIACLLLVMVTLMVLLVGGVSPDVMRHAGDYWENTAAKAVVERGMAAPTTGPEHEP